MSTYRTEFVIGKVLREQKHVEPHIYSEGGGGYVGPHGGRVKAPEVKSYNTTRHDIFLLLENGQEISVSFPFNDIMLREGHVVTLISVFRDAANDGFYVRLLNHNTVLIYNVVTEAALNSLTGGNPKSSAQTFGCLGGLVLFFVAGFLQQFFSNVSEGKEMLIYATIISFIIAFIGHTKYNAARNHLINKNKADLEAEINKTIVYLSN